MSTFASHSRRYRHYGLTIESNVTLPGLPAAEDGAIDVHVEVMRALPEGQEALIVEIVTGRLAVDQRPFESELADRPFELDGGGHRILHRHGGETSIAARPLLYLPR